MDLEKLKTFYHVAIEGSIKKAEPSLGIKSSFISKQITSLEKALNVKLFKRHYRGLTLTEHGTKLFTSTQHIMNEAEKISDAFKKRNTENLRGVLRILTTVGISSYYTVDVVKKFVHCHPNMHIKMNCELQTIDFRDYQADIAILPKPTQGSDYINKRIMDAHTSVYASRDYLQNMGTPKTIEDLVNHRLIAYRYDKLMELAGVDFHVQAAKKVDPNLQPYLTINSLPGYFYAGAQGLGIIVMPDKHPFLKEANFVKILPELFIDIPIYLSYHVNSGALRKVQAFKHLAEEIKHEDFTLS